MAQTPTGSLQEFDPKRKDGPLDCRGAAVSKTCVVLTPAGATAIELSATDEQGERIKRVYRRFSETSLGDGDPDGEKPAYREATIVLYDVSLGKGNGRRTHEQKTREIARSAILELESRPDSTVIFATFDQRMRIRGESGPADQDGGALIAARSVADEVGEIDFEGVTTFLYTSVIEAVRRLEREKATLKRIVLISDGVAEETQRTLGEAERAAKEAGVFIDTVGAFWANPQQERRAGEEVLYNLARNTGGEFFAVDLRSKDQADAFTRERYGASLADRRRQSMFVDLTSDFTQAALKLTLSFDGDHGGGVQTFTASIDKDCPEDKDLQACRDQPQPSASGADRFGEWWETLPGWAIWAGAAAIGVLVIGLIALLAFRGDRNKPAIDDGWASASGSGSAPPRALPPMTAGSGDATVMAGGTGGRIFRMDDPSAPPFNLGQERVRIGRAETNDLILKHESVSRVHAEIHLDPRSGRMVITDLNSLNHVFVNGSRISSGSLSPGDVIKIGDVQLRYEG